MISGPIAAVVAALALLADRSRFRHPGRGAAVDGPGIGEEMRGAGA